MPVVPPFPQLEILHRADRFVVVNKPPGLLSVPGKGPEKADCVAARVKALFPEAVGPITVHRLDMDTSGLIVCALDKDTQRELSRQFEAREVEKQYVALVDGVTSAESGTIELPIRTDIHNRPYQIVDHINGKPSRTAWRVLAIETDRTRLGLVPLTGRTHQLRVHCAISEALGGLGHPILGDVLYGDAASADRLMLHACTLTITDPDRRERVHVESPAAF